MSPMPKSLGLVILVATVAMIAVPITLVWALFHFIIKYW